ncbi:MAG: T9SS type A sorting domain-containing protein [Bacteroidia bacterium]|nr:T9SS type A sorting domain-containing protein [Bacteroidia bacterium]
MGKYLLFILLLISLYVYPQNGKQSKSYSVIEIIPTTNFNLPSSQNTSSVIKPIIKTKPVINSHSKTSAVTANLFTGSMDVFAYTISQSNPLHYNPSTNAVSFVARKSSTYTAATNNNSSAIVGLYTTNFGTTWNETCLWTNSTNLTRYVQGGMWNPLGNTNINNIWMVACGPITTGSAWDGNWYASKQLSTPGTTTPGIVGVDQQSFLDSSPTLKKHSMSRYSFTTIDGGFARSIGTIVNDINATNNVAYGLRGAALVKGQFNAGAFVWSVDSFIPPVNTKPSNGTKLLKDVALQAWSENGSVGYIVMIGSRLGASPIMHGMQPIVYVTTNSGITWSLLPANNFTDPVNFSGLYQRTYATASNTNVICANFSGSEGFDAAVDVNGQLHFVTTVLGHSSNHLDSLNYRYAFGPEQYSYRETGPFFYPVIYDFYTKSSGGWNYHMVDSMGTEGPSGLIGQPGYTYNPWSNGSGSKISYDARIQVSRTADGSKIFYSWAESDSTVVGAKWNIYPDILMKGFDVVAYKVTPRINVTMGVTNINSDAYFHYMSGTASGSSLTCNTVPITITRNPTYDGSTDVNTFYLDGAQLCPSNFSLTPMAYKSLWCPWVVSVKTEEALNFYVSNFPNPANDATTIVVGLKEASNFEVVIYNSIGQMVDTYKVNGQVGSNEINIDLSNFKSGIYFYNVKVGGSVVTKKLIVQ